MGDYMLGAEAHGRGESLREDASSLWRAGWLNDKDFDEVFSLEE